MPSSPSQIKAEFLANVPDEAMRLFTQCIWLGYAEAFDRCQEQFLYSQANDLRGHWRRAAIERNLRNVVSRIPGATQTQERNKTNSHNHTVVRMGRVILTQSQAEGPDDIVQFAEFRKTYSESSQWNLFRNDGDEKDDSDGHLYAMLLHGPVFRKPSQPRFVSVVFPTKSSTAYVYDATISMFERFEDLAAATRNDRVEEIPDELKLDLRRLDRADDDKEESA